MQYGLPLKIGLSGVRGVAGEALTPQLVTSFAAAFGTYSGDGAVAIATDTRPSRVMVSQAAIAGLLSVGCTPLNLGIVPVPTLQLYTRESRVVGGICISASHNPSEWNALKFFGPDGIILRSNQFAELLDLYHQGVYPRVAAHEIADLQDDDSAPIRHRDAVIAAVDAGSIRGRGFRVVVDCCNGAAHSSAPAFLRALGCDVIELNTDSDAPFPRNPEPVPETLEELSSRVREVEADVGFALDADADRLAVIGESGEPLGEDCTLALVVDHVLRRQKGPVVVNVSTSRVIDDIAARHGCTVYRTPVGEANVVERMLECGAGIGGEGTGGVIAPAVNPCRDSFVGMAHILEALAAEGGTVSDLRARFPDYSMVKEAVPCRPRDVAPALRLLRQRHRGDLVDLTDGVKVVWPDRWVHVRGSNTEPVLRVAAEARSEDDARTLVRSVLEFLRLRSD